MKKKINTAQLDDQVDSTSHNIKIENKETTQGWHEDFGDCPSIEELEKTFPYYLKGVENVR